jgi:hypothetical protein
MIHRGLPKQRPIFQHEEEKEERKLKKLEERTESI